ncbi:hypothetical protein RF11_10427 [Thelohanellus kitauei]|uniref:Peptidase A2 domain-containing protein n=1 Tax=Thelohanellus kitauei TaxID=669202 RepID=A0A0C2JBA3_THEKT|nr:hypothetical protein RF11_10427 [Thelohanellus kitauei]
MAFAVRVKKAAKGCLFGTSLNERVLDQFEIGLNHKRIQEELFLKVESPNMLMADVVKIATSLETEKKEKAKLDDNPQPKKEIPEKTCRRCGVVWHRDFGSCPARDKSCNYFGTVGHSAEVCFKASKRQQGRKADENKPRVFSIQDDSESLYSCFYNKINRAIYTARSILIDVVINVKEVCMDLDTGATLSCISFKLWQ